MGLVGFSLTYYGYQFNDNDLNEFMEYCKGDSILFNLLNKKKLISKCNCGEIHIVNSEWSDGDAYFCKKYYCDKCSRELEKYSCGICKDDLEKVNKKYHLNLKRE